MSEICVSGLCLDSRQIQFGDLFIAIQGTSQDGRDHIPMAVKKGAAAVLTERPLNDEAVNADWAWNIPIIEFPNLKNSVSHIAGRFFSEPSKAMKVIGITGTNGKTSTAQWIAQLFSAHQQACGILGTLGQGFLNALKTHDCTTPDPISTQKILADFREQGAKAVVMEVTSHALTQGRVEGVQFHTAVFTNLTRDHLDYHKTMEAYFQAKKRLFMDLKPAFSILNLDDPYGRQLAGLLSERRDVVGYSIQPDVERPRHQYDMPVILAKEWAFDALKMKALLQSPWGEAELICPLLGRFNLSNVLAAIAVLCVQGFSFKETIEAAKLLTAVPGRMVRLGGEGAQPLVVIDFAHTPDALAQVLTVLRVHCQGQLWCVFGCGGDRDRGKRPQMGKVAEELSDKMVITQDNSRTEPFSIIQEDILQGITAQERVIIEPDRAKAIQWTIASAHPNDIILIAGKGHEEYQIIQTDKIPFSDHTVADQALSGRV